MLPSIAAAEEIWRPVDDYQGRYEVSNLGRVRSVGRAFASTGHRKARFYPGTFLKLSLRKGYLSASLSWRHKLKHFTVHRLVCIAFHGAAPSHEHEVAHYDGNRLNARADNLRWATKLENEADKLRHGRRPMGEKTNRSKLSSEQARIISRTTGPRREIAEVFGVSPSAIENIRKGRTWKHLAGSPDLVPRTSRDRYFTIDGQTKRFCDWCREFDVDASLVLSRLAAGWPVDRAFKASPRLYMTDRKAWFASHRGAAT